MTGGRPAQEIAGKYHLSSRQIIFNWMDKYVNEREIVSLPETEEDMANKTPEKRMKELEAENKRFIKALELEKLQSEAYSTIPRIIHQLPRFLAIKWERESRFLTNAFSRACFATNLFK